MDPAEERAIVQHELDYRRARRWSIFTWVNTILLAVTGGVTALEQQTNESLGLAQKVVLSGAVLVLGLYSSAWWKAQRSIGTGLRQRLNDIDAKLDIRLPDGRGGVPDQIGAFYLILLLTIAAIAAIWLSGVVI